MCLLSESSLFTRWTDPASGVESFMLTGRIAPLQQSFYFTHSGFSDDGRYLWFYCAFPPGGDAYYGRQLGVVDFAESKVRHFPETQFMDASPYVDGASGDVYWCTGLEVWKRGPGQTDHAEQVGSFPEELAKGRRPLRIATHLTRSADGKCFGIDALIGTDCFVGALPLDGSDFQLWGQFDFCLNHAQFSPTDPDLMLLAGDGWTQPASGERGRRPHIGGKEERMWLLRRGQELRPVCPEDTVSSDKRGHEWWDADGKHVWYIDYGDGTAKVNIHTGEQTRVWRGGHTHSHNEREGRYLVGDVNAQSIHPHMWRTSFYNILSGREIDIVSPAERPEFRTSRYHIHPHPHFCLNDQYVCYTTNVLGSVDVALVAVDQVVGRTGEGVATNH